MPNYSGNIVDGAKRLVLSASFGIMDAAGNILAGPTPVDNGTFEISSSADGEQLFVGAPGYVTKIIPVSMLATVGNSVEINKPFPFFETALVLSAAYYVLGRKKKRKGKIGAAALDQSDIKMIFWLVGGVLAFDTIRKILEAFGFWKSADSRQLDAAAADPNSFWNPNYWQQSQNYSYAISTAQAQGYAKQIYDAFGMFNDCEECVIAVFRSLRTKANVSFLAYVFQQQYGQDLLSFLRGGLWPQDRLSDEDVAGINSYVNSLPAF